MLENRYYAIEFFSNEWWINNIITTIFVFSLLYIAKKCSDLYKGKK